MIDNKSCNRIMFMHIYVVFTHLLTDVQTKTAMEKYVQARHVASDGRVKGGPPFLVANIFLLYLDIKHELLWSLIPLQTSYEDVKNLSETK